MKWHFSCMLSPPSHPISHGNISYYASLIHSECHFTCIKLNDTYKHKTQRNLRWHVKPDLNYLIPGNKKAQTIFSYDLKGKDSSSESNQCAYCMYLYIINNILTIIEHTHTCLNQNSIDSIYLNDVLVSLVEMLSYTKIITI